MFPSLVDVTVRSERKSTAVTWYLARRAANDRRLWRVRAQVQCRDRCTCWNLDNANLSTCFLLHHQHLRRPERGVDVSWIRSLDRTRAVSDIGDYQQQELWHGAEMDDWDARPAAGFNIEQKLSSDCCCMNKLLNIWNYLARERLTWLYPPH